MMKIILYTDHEHSISDLKRALDQHHNQVVFFRKAMTDYEKDSQFERSLELTIESEQAALVFSMYYYPVISSVCQRIHVPYVSWVFDSPSLSTYSNTIHNSCNYVFLFDRQNYNELKSYGVQTVYYLPLAVDTDRLSSIKMSSKDRKQYGCDVSLMANLYENNLFSKIKYLPPHLSGYLDSIMKAQIDIFGYNFLEHSLTDDIISEFKKYVKFDLGCDYFMTDRQMITDVFLTDKLAFMERIQMIEFLSKKYRLTLYTGKHTYSFHNVDERGYLDYNTTMPKAFKASKININTSKRSIKTGLPLRLLDIMGCGGFVISNYQEELWDHFEPDKDVVIYESLKDLSDKIQYYLEHEDERNEIAHRGFEKVRKYYNYQTAIDRIFYTVREERIKR